MSIEPRPTATEPRSRRAILAGALTGLAGLVAGRVVAPDNAEAASGDPLVLGSLTNSAGTASTKLSTSTVASGTALYVQQNGTGTALRGLANTGIAGFFTSSNGTGVSGVTAKNNQFGVYGANDALTNGGGEAIRANGQQNHGLVATTVNTGANAVKAVNSGVNGVAILGQATATTGSPGTGVLGQTDGEFGSGLYGLATSTTGTPNGLYAAAAAPAGNAVFGQMTSLFSGGGAAVRAEGDQNHGLVATTASVDANAIHALDTSTGTAIFGRSTPASGTSGQGVHGQADGVGGTGVVGYGAASSGISYGVYAQSNSAAGYGVYSYGNAQVVGDLDVSGAITATTKDFKIDHPLDPAQKFLSHSCVESDDRRTVYDGEVTLDAKGEATVTLPAWFETLNKSFRYQLTAIGPSDQHPYVKSKVKGNAFSIGGGNAGQEVCWQLTGIRQDPYARAHPLAVEAAKTGTERGRYLHPEVYGKPASSGIDALHARPVPAPAGH